MNRRTTLTALMQEVDCSRQSDCQSVLHLVTSVAEAVKAVSRFLFAANVEGRYSYSHEQNVHGEKIHVLDKGADQILLESLVKSKNFSALVSEEREHVFFCNESASYIIAFDPLDGSNNLGLNISVGTIFGIFRRLSAPKQQSEKDFFQPGTSLIAAGYSIYGMTTSLIVSVGNGVMDFTFDPELDDFVLMKEKLQIPDQGGVISFNDCNTVHLPKQTQEYLSSLKADCDVCASRYVGTLAVDIDRTLRRGGIYIYPGNKKSPDGKLRLLYECLPLAFLLEQAGGAVSDGCDRLLTRIPKTIHEHTGFVAGSKRFVDEFIKNNSSLRE
jgi:fructose-1,6-bisphosphatase I